MFLAFVNTLEVTLIGFLFGGALAFLLAYISFHNRFIDNMLGGVTFFLFSSPLIVL